MKITIKARFTDSIKIEGTYESLRDAVEKNRANLYDANLYDANLRGADLCGANLRGADLRGADLRGADLRGANLYDANLYDANLYDANLCGADLRGADLRGADLCGADLRGADLYDANLYDANLYDANLYDANLRGADGEKLTIYQNPIFIQGLRWDVMIYADIMTIGCESHKVSEWVAFKPSRIKLMDDEAAKFWATNKEALLTLAMVHAKEHEKLAKKATKEAT